MTRAFRSTLWNIACAPVENYTWHGDAAAISGGGAHSRRASFPGAGAVLRRAPRSRSPAQFGRRRPHHGVEVERTSIALRRRYQRAQRAVRSGARRHHVAADPPRDRSAACRCSPSAAASQGFNVALGGTLATEIQEREGSLDHGLPAARWWSEPSRYLDLGGERAAERDVEFARYRGAWRAAARRRWIARRVGGNVVASRAGWCRPLRSLVSPP